MHHNRYFTELQVALDTDDFKAAKEILERGGVDLNRHDGCGRTLLSYCVPSGIKSGPLPKDGEEDKYVKRAKLLVAHGASINLQDKGGWTVVHQCAWFGYFPLLEYFILKGGDITMVTNNSQNSLDLALIRGHTQIVDYLDLQSGNLKQHCRRTIRKSLGFKCDTKIQHLILPSSLKLFLNYGNPYPGWLGPAAVIQPWPLADVRSGKVLQKDVQDFLQENASEDFLKEQTVNKQNMSQDELANLIERLYFWEEFKQVTYEEPPSRPPRYSMEAIAPRPPLVPDH